jgi:hypothetical protein
MTHETFVTNNRHLLPDLATKIAQELINFEMPPVSTIVAGVDPRGSHIYVVSNGQVTCQDRIGFAAIGAGAWHAESLLMFSGHTVARPFPETMLLTYSAKKRAEVAPGVGTGTDMFMVGNNLGSFTNFARATIDSIHEIYQTNRESHIKADEDALKGVMHYVVETLREASEKSKPEQESAALIDSPDGTPASPDGAPAGNTTASPETKIDKK